jgi:hypothetical protein
MAGVELEGGRVKLSKLSVLVGVTLVVGCVVATPAATASAVKPTVSALLASPPMLGSGGGTATLSASVMNGATCTFTSNKPVAGLTSAPCATGIVADTLTFPPNTTKKPVKYTLKLKVYGARSAKSTHVYVTVDGGPPPLSGLTWTSPPAITVGTPFTMSSIDKCPTTMPDGSAITGTLYVIASIAFPSTAAGDAVPANPDGSWTISMSINGLYPSGSFTASADCYVYPSGPMLATYATHSIAVSSPA